MVSRSPQNGVFAQLEHSQARHIGTGHPDTTQHEWATNIHRDSIASYLGRPSMLQYFGIAEGVSVGRIRYHLFEKMHRPCGEAPKKKKLDEISPGDNKATK